MPRRHVRPPIRASAASCASNMRACCWMRIMRRRPRALPSDDVDDLQLRAEILVQRARLARGAGDIAVARTHATAAHDAALAAVAPVPYFPARVELAEALDAARVRGRGQKG